MAEAFLANSTVGCDAGHQIPVFVTDQSGSRFLSKADISIHDGTIRKAVCVQRYRSSDKKVVEYVGVRCPAVQGAEFLSLFLVCRCRDNCLQNEIHLPINNGDAAALTA